MISHKKAFIFIHIPKTGGTTIEFMLRRHGIVLQGKGNFDSIYYKHATAESIKRMLGDEYDRYFKFTFMRNPLDWIVSNYAFNRGLAKPYVDGTEYSICGKVPDWAEDMSFSEWLYWWIHACKPTQSEMFVGTNGKSLVDCIYRFENINSDFDKLRLQFGLNKDVLPHLKKSKRKIEYKDYYDEHCLKLAHDHFELDFQYWTKANNPTDYSDEKTRNSPLI